MSHRVQGEPTFPGGFTDPDYETVLRDIISSKVIDFVGEEGGDSTTVAEKIAKEMLGDGHYLNVEPEDRGQHGIGETFSGYRLSGIAGDEIEVLRWFVAENEKRERIWVDHLIQRTNENGLLICGLFHAFSVAAKVLDRGFKVEARTYVPWKKLA